MKKELKISILLLLISIFGGWANDSSATPSVSSVSGTVSHGQTITVSGSAFGMKSPALPLWWDDGDGATLETPSILTSGEMDWVTSGALSSTNKHYSDAWPRTLDAPIAACMQYRQAPLNGVSAPHSRATNLLVGHHDDADDCRQTTSRNVGITISDGTPHPTWYINYYHRLDPNWPTCTGVGCENNWKFFNWEYAPPYTMYSTTLYDNYAGCGIGKAPGCGESYAWGRIFMNVDGSVCPSGSPTYGYPWITGDTSNPSPVNEWQRWEHFYHDGGDYTSDVLKLVVKNKVVMDIDLDADCDLSDYAHSQQLGGVSIGGFWRRWSPSSAGLLTECPDYPATQTDHNYGANARRYYTEVYVDTTFSRIMLCDDAIYNSATVCEPQIPSAWSEGSLMAEVNLGKLPDTGTAYLFVFDADNNHNTTGYPVTLGGGGGGGDTTAPSAPTGLAVM